MSVTLHIERLVIDAALLGDARASQVRVALERELAQRLRRPGAANALRGLGAIAALPAAELPIARPGTPLHSRIATAVWRGIAPPAATAGGAPAARRTPARTEHPGG